MLAQCRFLKSVADAAFWPGGCRFCRADETIRLKLAGATTRSGAGPNLLEGCASSGSLPSAPVNRAAALPPWLLPPKHNLSLRESAGSYLPRRPPSLLTSPALSSHRRAARKSGNRFVSHFLCSVPPSALLLSSSSSSLLFVCPSQRRALPRQSNILRAGADWLAARRLGGRK